MKKLKELDRASVEVVFKALYIAYGEMNADVRQSYMNAVGYFCEHGLKKSWWDYVSKEYFQDHQEEAKK